MLNISLTPEIATLRREFANVSNKLFATALSRALNHVGAKVKTEASRDIRKKYRIPAKNVSADMRLIRATKTKLTAKVEAIGAPMPAQAFGPRQTRKGVSINVGGTRQLLRSAFIVNLANGHKGVFARGKYDGTFQWRKQREDAGKKDLAINEIMSKSVPRAFMHTTVIDAMKGRVASDLPQRVRHEVRWALSERTRR